MNPLPPTIRRAASIALLAAGLTALAACTGPATTPAAPASPTPTAASPAPASAAPPSAAPTSPAPASATPAADATAISIDNFEFNPASLTVKSGTTVTWTNDEDSLHTATAGTPDAPTGLFDSGEIDTGVEFPFTFTEAGTYPFFCARHDFMRGAVTVTP